LDWVLTAISYVVTFFWGSVFDPIKKDWADKIRDWVRLNRGKAALITIAAAVILFPTYNWISAKLEVTKQKTDDDRDLSISNAASRDAAIHAADAVTYAWLRCTEQCEDQKTKLRLSLLEEKKAMAIQSGNESGVQK
jgi:hypothetical protein